MHPIDKLRLTSTAWFAGTFVLGAGLGIIGTVLVFTSKIDARDDEIARLRAPAAMLAQAAPASDEFKSLQSFSEPAPARTAGVEATQVASSAVAAGSGNGGGAAGAPVASVPPATGAAAAAVPAPAATAGSVSAPVVVASAGSNVVARVSVAPTAPAAAAAAAPAPAPAAAARPAPVAQPSAAVVAQEAEAKRQRTAEREREELERRALAATAAAARAAQAQGGSAAAGPGANARRSEPAVRAASTGAPATPYGPTVRVTFDDARIAEITAKEIVFRSGVRVALGEKFPNGQESLKSLDPNTGEIVTSTRRIVVSRSAPVAVAPPPAP